MSVSIVTQTGVRSDSAEAFARWQGETSTIIADLTTGSPGLQSDRIRTLAVTSKERSRKYPDVPTLDEAGVAGYEVNTWIGFFAPDGTPKDAVSAIETAIKEAVAMPDVRARLETTGANMRSGSAEEMRQLLAVDVAKWATLVKEKKIKITP